MNPEPTLVVFTDHNTPDFLMHQTIAQLIEHFELGVIAADLTTDAGREVAEAAVQAAISFRELKMGENERMSFTPATEREVLLREAADEPLVITPADIASLDANIALAPALRADGKSIDVTESTINGTIYALCEKASLAMAMIAPPEMGLNRTATGYIRYVAAAGFESEQDGHEKGSDDG